jgi:3-methyladenine DNA glycosylase AlkD
MTLQEVLAELKEYGNESTKRIFLRHGAREPFFGVKVQYLKKLVKKLKKNHELSLELYATGNSDAMYLAGLIADETRISRSELERWADEAYWYMLSEYTVPWVAGESEYGYELGMKWIESDQERIAAAGWATMAYQSALIPDEELNLATYRSLLDRAVAELEDAPNRVRFVMNGFVIAIGGNIAELTAQAVAAAEKIGKVHVDVGGTSCKVPLATQYIQKVVDRGTVGKKRKSARK